MQDSSLPLGMRSRADARLEHINRSKLGFVVRQFCRSAARALTHREIVRPQRTCVLNGKTGAEYLPHGMSSVEIHLSKKRRVACV
jgi:hypothetical protein